MSGLSKRMAPVGCLCSEAIGLESLIGHTIIDMGYVSDWPLTLETIKDGDRFRTHLLVSDGGQVYVAKQTRQRECDEA